MPDPIVKEPVVDPNDPEPKVPEPIPGLTIEELATQLEQIKKAQSGSDAAYQKSAKQVKDLEAENEKLKKESMNEKERADFEREQKEKELSQREREVNDATLRLSLIEGLGAAEMGTEWADFIPGEDEKELIDNIGKLKELIDKEVGKRVNSTLISTTKPKGGETVIGKPVVDTKDMSLAEIEKMIRGNTKIQE